MYSDNSVVKQHLNALAGIQELEKDLFQMYGQAEKKVNRPEEVLKTDALFE